MHLEKKKEAAVFQLTERHTWLRIIIGKITHPFRRCLYIPTFELFETETTDAPGKNNISMEQTHTIGYAHYTDAFP